jgi:glycosyltransferase involved in cell wall biosynthesis
MKISIVILNHNNINFIDRAIRSCLNQIRIQNEIEVIVIDDASTDGSVEKLYEYKSDIKLIQNEKNMGVGYSSNIGLNNASGDYFIRVDADDFISPFATTILEMALSSNINAGYAFCDHYLVDAVGFKVSTVKVDLFQELINYGAGVMFKTFELKKIGGYNDKLRYCEDMDLLFRLRDMGVSGVHVPIPLYRYYIHGKNLSRTKEQTSKAKGLIQQYGI